MRDWGVDLSTVDSLSRIPRNNRTLILDGDGPVYRAASTVKNVDTAVRRVHSEILQTMFMAKCTYCTVHLTSRDCGKNARGSIRAYKPYQGNRKGKAKPPLLELVREALAASQSHPDGVTVILHRDIEADDGMMQEAFYLEERGVIASDDKDLRMTPYPYYDKSMGIVMPSTVDGWVELDYRERSGTAKLSGRGPMFFWGQMLCGDQADNVQGIITYEGKPCGPVTAHEILRSAGDQHNAANIVMDAYRAINQNIIAEGWLLWLTRWDGDNVIDYMRSLNLSKENREYLEECEERDWFNEDGEELQQ